MKCNLLGRSFRMTALEEEDEEDDDAEEGEGKKRLPGKATVSHTSYLMMKGYCYPGIGNWYNLSPGVVLVLPLSWRSTGTTCILA